MKLGWGDSDERALQAHVSGVSQIVILRCVERLGGKYQRSGRDPVP